METIQYTRMQLFSLVCLRMLVGWHFLYEVLVKLLNPGWSAQGYLIASQGPFSKFFVALGNQSGLMVFVDIFNMGGLALIGLALILGCAVRWAAVFGMMLLSLYYLAYPPFGNLLGVPVEGSYLIVNKTLIEIGALWVLKEFCTSKSLGLDGLFASMKSKKKKDAAMLGGHSYE
ncbi:MAG: DoxX family membrane protein [Cellvibrionaceae bacterium]|nr:DoxX family membrane protein [Cellvibrionaceae bacterium]